MNTPVILFACVHNSGRSVAARVLAEHYGAGRVVAISAGSEPGDAINPVVAHVLAERGLSAAAETPKLLEYDTVAGADVVITMGCGEACPVVPGKRHEDWLVEDPHGQDLETVRAIVNDIDDRVRALLADLGREQPSSPAAALNAVEDHRSGTAALNAVQDHRPGTAAQRDGGR
jgi:arsenate reductase